MSETETINIKTTLTAHDLASPVLNGLLKNLRKVEASIKRFNTAFDIMGKAGASAMAGINRNAESVITRMNRVSESVRDASRTYSDQWQRATDQRLRDARHMYREIDKLERDHQRQAERRQAAERRANGQRYGREFGRARMPAPRLRSLALGGAIAMGGVAGAFKQRMDVQAAEVRTQMFGDLSKAETNALRKSFADKAGIKYGVGVTKALDAATEGLKAGIAKDVVGSFAGLTLKAQAGLDVSLEDTSKLLGRLATQLPWNEGRFSKILNAVAVANNATAASGEDIMNAMRRSLSALVVTKMTPEQLSAVNATGISLGIPAYRMGSFTGFLAEHLAGADSARGQSAKDLSHAARVLGFGSRAGMSKIMRENPMQAIYQILENLAKMQENMRARVANEIGGREWGPKLLTLVLGRDKLKEVNRDIENKPGFLDKVALQKIQSLQGRWASITAAMGLFFEKMGAGFEVAFTQISDGILNIADTFNFDSIRDHFAALVDGLREGFGLKDWGEAVKSMADMFDAGSIAKWKAFAKGFAEGLREIVAMLKGAFTGIASLFGKGDAESMGKFTARLLGLTVALALLAPVVNLLGSISLFLLTIGAVASGAATGIAALFIALMAGLKFALSWVADKIFSAFTSIVDPIVDAIKSIATRSWDWIKGLFGFGGASPTSDTSSGATDFSGSRRRVAALSASPASYISSDVSGLTGSRLSQTAFESTFAGTALAGQHDAIVAAAKANGIPPALLAAVIAHETGKGRNVRANNVAGIMNPGTGYRTKQGFATLSDGIAAAGRVVAKNYRAAGGDLDKMSRRYAPIGADNDPNGLNAGWVNGVRSFRNTLSGGVGVAGLGDPVAEAKRYLGKNEYANRAELSNLIGHDVAGNANAWCARFVNTMLEKTGGNGTGSAIANSFLRYGQRVMDKASVARGDVLVQPNGRGVDQSGGHVGFATGRTRMKDGRLQLEMRSGNDGDSVRDSWRDASKLEVRRGLTANVPSPAEAIRNVPQSNGAITNSLLQRKANGNSAASNGCSASLDMASSISTAFICPHSLSASSAMRP